MTNFTHAKYGPDTVRIDDPTYVVPLLTEDVTVGTGLAFPATDTVAIEAGGVEKARFTSTLNSLAGVTTLLANSASAALTVTQTGAGNAFVVEDSASTDSTPFVVGADGKVAIGTTTAVENLNILSNTRNFVELTRASSNTGQSVLSFRKARGDLTTPTVVSSGDASGSLNAYGYDGSAYVQLGAIDFSVDGTPGASDMPGRLVFSTTADGASSPTERMRIDSAGNVGIGATPYAGVNLYIAKPLTGGVSVDGVAVAGRVNSDVTTRATIFGTYPSTEAAVFTLPSLFHYAAGSNTFGAGSTVTNQYGYYAYNTLTGATNNYGFYSNIAAATGRWNFYAAGTAANYFAGDVQLGKTVTAGGTTGAQTINKTVGTVNFAAAATSLVVTNSLVTANSIITATVGTNDTTMKSVAVVAAAGSFTLHANAAATAETRVNFHVFN